MCLEKIVWHTVSTQWVLSIISIIIILKSPVLDKVLPNKPQHLLTAGVGRSLRHIQEPPQTC